jgi:glycosyltransferase involved in cell wall biosynthesis
LRARLAARFETAVMKHAATIIANAPRACDAQQAAYPASRAKMVVITNGYDPESFNGSPAGPRGDGALRIVHTGEVYAGRNPGPLLEALRTLEAEPRGPKRLSVRFIGQTHGLATAVRKRGLDHVVTCVGQVSHAQALEDMRRADVLLLLDSPGRLAGVPAKLYEYLGASRPILALAEPEGDVAWVLRESGVTHRIAAPTDPVLVKTALVALIEDHAQPRDDAAGRDWLRGFTRERMAQRLAQALNALVRGATANRSGS